MIDIRAEELLSLSQAARLAILPRRRRGKRPCVATLHRWATSGCRGVILETVQFGGAKCTSREALQRFVDELTRASQPNTPRVRPVHDRTLLEIRLRRHRVSVRGQDSASTSETPETPEDSTSESDRDA